MCIALSEKAEKLWLLGEILLLEEFIPADRLKWMVFLNLWRFKSEALIGLEIEAELLELC